MTARVNPNIVPDLLVGLNQVQLQLNEADTQLASGKTINTPSDNPAGAAALILNSAEQSSNDTFQQNISDLQSKMQIADSALNSAVNAINQAISLGTEGGNSDLSDQDRQAIANQLSGIQQELLGIANTTVGGTYLFGGTLVETQPFTLDPASLNGVDYHGNNSAASVEIANGQSVSVNVPGSQLFLNPAGNLFGSVQQLITALQTNSGIGNAVTSLGQASSEFDAQRLSYGSALNQLQATDSFLSSENTQLVTQQSNIDAADIAKVTTNFSQEEVAYQSVLSAEGKILSLPNLLNYLS